MKIKKGDTVYVKSGADKGKTGKVLHAFPKELRALVEGVNVKKRHQKSRKSGEKGQIIDKPLPVQISNLMLIDPKSGKPTRVGISRKEGVKAVRIAKKSGAVIEK